MNARFTLVGYENALNDLDKSLKDPWILDNENFDAETLLSTIIMKGAQMEPLYSDPLFFYKMNGQWWNKWKNTFQKWCDVLDKEYEPLWNKDYHEEIHEDTYDVGTNDTATQEASAGHEEGEKHDTIDDTEQLSGKDQVDHDFDRDTDTTNEVSAFDSSSYQPHDTSHTDDIMNSENTDTTYGKKTKTDTQVDTTHEVDNTLNKSGTIDNDTTNDRDFDRSAHLYGNIGVATTQSLVKEELELRYWNVYDHISDIFLDELIIRVY